MLKKQAMELYEVTQENTSCMFNVEGVTGLDLTVKCVQPVTLNAITVDGEVKCLDIGTNVHWRGPVTGYSAVEVVANTSFLHLCRRSGKWYEIPDPRPLVVELKQTETDVIRAMIDERLRQYKVHENLNRELTEDEKDALILDIVNGDLEFEEGPDQFGLGYEEAVQTLTRGPAEQSEPPEAVSAEAPATAPTSPAAVSNSSST